MLRVGRVVVVGDPLQLEPVVTLPLGGQRALLRLDTANRWKWVGTVHTMQGKEADVVILVLGGNPDRPNARKFATETPNLLNVAVTRARRRLYVIGDRETWASERYFDVLVTYVEQWQPASQS